MNEWLGSFTKEGETSQKAKNIARVTSTKKKKEK